MLRIYTTSHEGLHQVYDGMYKFLSVVNLGAIKLKKEECSAGYGFTTDRVTDPPQAT
jgi:hypothetical protein